MRLDLLAEGRRWLRRDLFVVLWCHGMLEVEVKVPGAYHAIAPTGISVPLSVCDCAVDCEMAYRIELSVSTASPFTPSLCPPAEFASGKTTRDQ